MSHQPADRICQASDSTVSESEDRTAAPPPMLSDGTQIKTRTVIWAGGLKAATLSANLGIEPGRGGRIDVQPDLTVKGFEGVYALGDFANVAGEDGKTLPQLASVAEQCGRWCAKNIALDAAGRSRKTFHYVDKGIMA